MLPRFPRNSLPLSPSSQSKYILDTLAGSSLRRCLLIFPILFRQTPLVFDLADSCQHLCVLLIDRRSFRHAIRLDHVAMMAGKDDEGLHAAGLTAANVFVGNTRGVV